MHSRCPRSAYEYSSSLTSVYVQSVPGVTLQEVHPPHGAQGHRGDTPLKRWVSRLLASTASFGLSSVEKFCTTSPRNMTECR